MPRSASRLFTLVIGLGALNYASVFAAPAPALSSPPIDLSMFRDGEVRRTHVAYGDWFLNCDEIVRLHHRYCSLASDLKNASDMATGTLVVSTGDDGRPAAMFIGPLGIDLRFGLDVQVIPVKNSTFKETVHFNHPFLLCDGRSCTAVWDLTAKEIVSLNKGGELQIRYRQVVKFPPTSARLISDDGTVLQESILARGGFPDAISASLQPVN